MFAKRTGSKGQIWKISIKGVFLEGVFKNCHAYIETSVSFSTVKCASHWDASNKKKIESISLPEAELSSFLWFDLVKGQRSKVTRDLKEIGQITKSAITPLLIEILTQSFFCFKALNEMHIFQAIQQCCGAVGMAKFKIISENTPSNKKINIWPFDPVLFANPNLASLILM